MIDGCIDAHERCDVSPYRTFGVATSSPPHLVNYLNGSEAVASSIEQKRCNVEDFFAASAHVAYWTLMLPKRL
jgi:hypothetical protein